jgi:hypothetical protein
LTGLGISTSSTTISPSRQKRKRDEEFVDGNSRKRSKSDKSQSDVAIVEITVDAEKREPVTTDLYSIQEAEPDSLAGYESETYNNQIHYCLMVSLVDQPLHAYKSIRELLEALCNAIRGRKSLEDRKILHRDISENNIIITEAAAKGDPKGMLIDPDLAKELDSLPSGASHRTSTM